MARTYTGTFKKAANYDIRKAVPFDARIVVDDIADLTKLDTWDTGDGIAWLYSGLVVAVINAKALYMLTGFDYTTAPNAYQDVNNWKRLDADAATAVEVINTLTSTSTTAALSAAQGKALNDKITATDAKATEAFSTANEAKENAKEAKDTANEAKAKAEETALKVQKILGDSTESLDTKLDNKIDAAKEDIVSSVKNDLGTVYSYKGSKATVNDLPTDAEAGDVWNVEAANGNIPAGTNYAWDGSKWDALGGTVDLSSYATKASVTADIATAKSDLETEIADAKKAGTDAKAVADAAKTAAETNATNITKVSGDLTALETSVNGRLDILDTSVGLHTTRLESIEKVIDTLTGGEDGTGVIEAIGAIKDDVLEAVKADYVTKEDLAKADYATKAELKVVSDKADKVESDLVTVKSDLTSVKSSLTILQGDATTEGSVDYKIKLAVDNATLKWKNYGA